MSKTTMKENKMGVLPIPKLLISMSLPMILSMLVQALYNIVDSMFVAQLNEEALTAVSLAFPVQNLMIAVAAGTGNDRDTPGDPLHHETDDFFVFAFCHGGAFTGGTAGHQCVDAAFDLPVNETAIGIIINRAIRLHGGNEGGGNTFKNDLFHGDFSFI